MENNKIFTKRILINILYILIFFLSITNIKSTITYEQLEIYFEKMTIDRMRQIYCNIVYDLISNNYHETQLKLDNIEYSLHSYKRRSIIQDLYYSLYYLREFDYYLDINKFESKMKEIDIFNLENLDKFINLNTPRNVLINLAINIDKYDRTKKRRIDGISDYINYLKKDKIIKYINDKLEEYNELNNTLNFTKIVLNNIEFDQNKDILEYCKNKSEDELIQIIYGFENYLFNEKEESEVLSYNYYDHENLSDRDKLIKLITLYNKEAGDINNLEDFILIIENRNFVYVNNVTFYKKDYFNNILAIEKYYNRQINSDKSLRGLKEYIEKMDNPYRKKIMKWGLSLYPELFEHGRFQDILSNEVNYQYTQVKNLLLNIERETLLRYAYNIHTYQNKIESIYNEDLYNLYRYKKEALSEIIITDTNSNRNLQSIAEFKNYGSLYKDDFCAYLKNLERNQLLNIWDILIELYFEEKPIIIDQYEKPSEKEIKKEIINNMDTASIISEAQEFVRNTNFEIQETSKFFESNKIILEKKYKMGFYNNIMDFFRSTNIAYLKLWLRKYEIIIRQLKSNNNIGGGIIYNFLNQEEYTKKKVLEIFDIYFREFPELFEANKLIEIVGLNNDNTPHPHQNAGSFPAAS